MTQPAHADAIVLGLGAMGSAVLHRLAERGLRVVGLDRHHPPHDRGSTHGDTRITRLAIGEGPEYAPLVRRSHALWRELERATGTTLMRQVGGLVIGDAADSFLAQTRANAVRSGIGHENLTHRTLAERFPMFAAPDGTEAYLEPEAGLLHPEAAVDAQLSLARRAGAQLRLGTEVESWHTDADGVAVTTAGGTLHARELVLCAGAWIPRLLPEYAELFAIHPQLLHWFPIRRGYEALRAMPIFIWEIPGERDAFTHLSGGFYGFPAIDGPAGGVKLATERYEQTIDPDEPVSPARRERETARFHEQYLARHFPWVGAAPLRTVSCLYTNTRGSRFMIGPHPAHPHVTIVAACSGHRVQALARDRRGGRAADRRGRERDRPHAVRAAVAFRVSQSTIRQPPKCSCASASGPSVTTDGPSARRQLTHVGLGPLRTPPFSRGRARSARRRRPLARSTRTR